MKTYSIPEAIVFLAKEYGEENMPTSEETLRRAIRTKKIVVQEEGDPGRKGYTIAEDDLRNYADDRMKRIQSRNIVSEKRLQNSMKASESLIESGIEEPKQFPEIYGQYMDGELTSSQYYKKLYEEKLKWEKQMYEKQERLARLMAQCKVIENDIHSCQSAINAYTNGIDKFMF